MIALMVIPGLLLIFLLAILVGYYYDYRHNKENYEDKGQGILYLIVIGGILLLLASMVIF
jgi:uncharacterized membrane protein